VFNIKSNSYYRSQLVTKWFSQVEEVNFDKLFFLFVCYEVEYLFIVAVVLEYCDIYTIDVKIAYLYSNLNKEIYMEQSDDFKLLSKEKKVWWLHKTLYGLKQASLFWWWTVTKSILALGFMQYKSDASIFIDKETRELIIAILYINDV